MYSNIFKIVLKNRLNLKIDFLIRLLEKVKIHIENKYMLVLIWFFGQYVGCFFIALGINFLSIYIDKKLILSIIFIYIGVNQFYHGIIEYKTTFIFVFHDLKEISLATDKKIYNTLLITNLTYKLITNSDLFLVSVLILKIFGFNFNSMSYIINILAISICLYISGNLIAGKYVYSKIIKKIGCLRFGVYTFFSMLIWKFIFNIVEGLLNYTNNLIKKNFTCLNDILNDFIWKHIFKDIEMSLLRKVFEIKNNLINLISFIDLKSFIITIIITAILIKYTKVYIIPTGKNTIRQYKDDIFYMYYKIISKLNNFFCNNKVIFKYQVEKLTEYRWLFANSFFELVAINYEAVCYLALFTALIANSDNDILRLQLMICMNIMILANQSFELRANAYPYFSFAKEKFKLELLKTSLISNEELFKTKLNSFRYIYIFHVLMMMIYSVLMSIIFRIPMVNLITILILDLALFFIMSLMQMHMVPMVTNFDYISDSQSGSSFEEEELANKLQEIPRLFLVVIPMGLTMCMLLMKSIRINGVIYIELLYLILSIAILYKYMAYIVRKGMKNLYDRISNFEKNK